MAKRKFPPTTIIGAGAVGAAFAIALAKKGYPIVSIISTTESKAKALSQKVRCKNYSSDILEIHPSSQFIVLAVPDSDVHSIAKRLSTVSSLRYNSLLVIHTSGMLAADVLSPLKRKGAKIAAVHPIQSFPKNPGRANKNPFSGIYFGVDSPKSTVSNVKKIVEDLDATMILIPKKVRPLYHATCVFSSSYIVTLLGAVENLSSTLNIEQPWHKVFGPLMKTVMENASATSPAEALTGPIVRGDTETLHKHIVSMNRSAKEIVPLYLLMGIEQAIFAKNKHRISEQEFKNILYLLDDSMKNISK